MGNGSSSLWEDGVARSGIAWAQVEAGGDYFRGTIVLHVAAVHICHVGSRHLRYVTWAISLLITSVEIAFVTEMN